MYITHSNLLLSSLRIGWLYGGEVRHPSPTGKPGHAHIRIRVYRGDTAGFLEADAVLTRIPPQLDENGEPVSSKPYDIHWEVCSHLSLSLSLSSPLLLL